MDLGRDGQIVLVAIYVDDILMCSSTEQLADDITAHLKAKFKCVNLGEISWCLAMRIQTSKCRHIITVDLNQYILSILARYELEHLSSVATPMLHDQRLTSPDSPFTDAYLAVMEDYPFRSAVRLLCLPWWP